MDIAERLRLYPQRALYSHMHEAADTITALRARVAELEQDAARYRWLRYGDNDELVIKRGPIHRDYVYLLRMGKLDAAIDAARKD